MEGNPATGDRVDGVHANGVINLRDPDTGNNIKGVTFDVASTLGGTTKGSYAATASDFTFTSFSRDLSKPLEGPNADPNAAAVQAIMINQCLKCHDNNGAQAFTGALPLSGMLTNHPAGTTRSAAIPFGTAISYSAIAAANGGTATVPTGAGVTALNTAGGVIDVNESFKSTNSSYHPVSARNNNRFVYATRAAAPWNAGITGRVSGPTSGTTNNYGYLISCWDCHAPNGTGSVILTNTVTAHGGATTVRGRPATSGASTTLSANAVTLCGYCHAGYTTNTSSTHGAGSAFNTNGQSPMDQYLRYGCNRCHSSGYTETTTGYVIRPARAQDVHGVNALPAGGTKTGRWSTGGTNSDARPYAFIRNTTTLSEHLPAQTTNPTGTTATYTPQCVHLTNGDCSSRTETYTPGGTY
jgi:hypothetical protein